LEQLAIDEHIRIRAAVLDAIEAHARRDAPDECCGLLIASAGVVEAAVPAINRASDPRRRYEIDPRDYLALVKRLRGSDDLVIGGYHSHPRSEPEPSPTDTEMAFGEFLYLIGGPVDGTVPFTVRAWRFASGNFRPVRLVPEPQEPQT
jgi:proteasome lid subunit RPN8/RPN11